MDTAWTTEAAMAAAVVLLLSLAAWWLIQLRARRGLEHDVPSTVSVLARRRRKKLAEMMRILSMAEEIADLGLWQYYPARNEQEWSGGMKCLFGLDHDDALMEGDAETLLAANEIDLVAEVMARKGRRGVFGLRMTVQRVDGSERDIRIRACHIDQEDAHSHRVIAVLMDVTDHARRERRLKESREIALREARRARELAETDPLTGLANRRRIMAELDRLVVLVREQRQPLSLILFDVDHFKRVNDRHGHTVGDEVLRQISMIAEEQVREGDILGRIGGEEFVWVVPGADKTLAGLAAERLRLAVAMGSGVGKTTPVTISLGIAAARPGDTALGLFARADAALYDAKHAGRNTVRLAA
ncbi:GGDEF domain-containing protein [Altererythrobacter arenosus]|uniref:diguanylate cyclase n=1 Tax=Altererythrobacter arenosus TaxID=3032592 RepID=A0ABY8FRP8_9SPHN|nr:GGDEF domain-containing protein [Altererythrobacter sp. CAU 1644]WFL76578.1 GGDEF domain-containing protein [Altererythrobacter sp. CAU 1644]